MITVKISYQCWKENRLGISAALYFVVVLCLHYSDYIAVDSEDTATLDGVDDDFVDAVHILMVCLKFYHYYLVLWEPTSTTVLNQVFLKRTVNNERKPKVIQIYNQHYDI